MVHATNFLVAPSKIPTLATVHDCSIVRHRSLCSAAVRALEPSLRRAIDRGIHIHVPSQFVANEVEDIFGPGLRAAQRIHVVHWGVPSLAPALRVPAEIARFGSIANGVPYNALHDKGYPSIGCEPCTRAVKPGEDPRAGRWWWEVDGMGGTQECGLHVKAIDISGLKTAAKIGVAA